ncbi:helix-turn-helix domain-containing protein [Streptomyces xantholiticus]|uniref:AraC-like ligand-binding domain-containing protein n=1 Tax=Streptomyces xantholiticus TaxID=68285 RepID=UPI001675677B|nr:helix-turn-helix domain-containing protein [Streptomyces xantholiticus]GGW67523.1 AraC family transcriptional regulator [Streptomyces xantholiticus]
MSIVLSTASVPARERLAYWHEAISQTYDQLASVRLDVSTPTDAPYRGTLKAGQLGSVRVATTDAGPLQVRQTTRWVAGRDDEYLNVCVQDRGHLVIDQNDSQTLLRPGALTLFDATRPYTVTYPAAFRMHVIQIPRWMLGVRESDLRRITAVPVHGDTETASLIIPFLSGLATQAGNRPPYIGDLLARNAADLLATLIAERLDRDVAEISTGTDAAHTALLLRIKAFVDRHLADSDLSPQTIAAAHYISVRHVHRLFQDEGTTAGRWIQHRRLEACRRELGRPGRNAPAVMAIAHRFGFTSPSHFSRTFRAAYGVSPREWRATAHLGSPA